MPELPEVETLVRGLRPALVGRRILGVRLGKTDFIDDPARLERGLPGQRIGQVARRGKFLVLGFDSAAGNGVRESLLVHLGMTGHLAPHYPGEPVEKHTHVFLTLDDGRELRYTDPRRFGRMALMAQPELDSALGRLGLEPLKMNVQQLAARLAARRARVKALLLDQSFLGGVGNIYADESLWRARIHPLRLADTLTGRQAAALCRSIQRVLDNAIRHRGSSISDYRDAEGRRGEFQRLHRAYDREGKPCFRCCSHIRRIIVAGRSSYFCPRCQRPPHPAGRKSEFETRKAKRTRN